MNASAPGPGWWLASDGNWYPPRWEYLALMRVCPRGGNLQNTLAEVQDAASLLGQQGWEMVNFAVVPQYSQGVGAGQTAMHMATRFEYQTWLVTSMLKRPIAP
jgi:hypothetical protein